jgi:glycosyltransferase involved in cell wall biosynthesis
MLIESKEQKVNKLAVFMPSLDGGGAERVTILLLNELAARGYAVDLLVAKGKGVYRSQVNPAINIIDLEQSRVATCLLPLAKYLRKNQPAALLSVMNYANVIAIMAKQLSRVNCRLVLTEHNDAQQALRHSTSLRYRFVSILTKWLYQKADTVVCVSEGVADSIERTLDIPRSQLSVVYNPVIHPGIRHSADISISHPFLPGNGEPLLLAVGRLTAQKNFPNLINAFSLVKQTRAAKLVILGEGEERENLTALIASLGLEQDVLMPGFVDNPYAWMRRADVFVLSSSWEGLPTVLIEALACGAKVVSTDCPSGPKEILENGRWGELVKMDDSNALASGIIKTLSEAQTESLEKRLEVFSIKYATDRYLETLKL